MKITLCISNYVDTIDVIIDEVKLDVKKLSFFSKAKFECTVEEGIHEIKIYKKSNILRNDWKKTVLFDWLSCLFGVPDWTLKEKSADTKIFSTTFKVNISNDIIINLKLTENGIKLIDDNDVFDISEQNENSKSAKKRITNLYIIPAILLAIIIGACMLLAVIHFVVINYYIKAIIFLGIFIFWIWFIYNMYSKSK